MTGCPSARTTSSTWTTRCSTASRACGEHGWSIKKVTNCNAALFLANTSTWIFHFLFSGRNLRNVFWCIRLVLVRAEEELLMKRSMGDLDASDRRSSSSARRSFFRRKKHQRSSSRDSKELASFSDVSINSFSDSGTLVEEMVPQTYCKVERLDCKFVLIFFFLEDQQLRSANMPPAICNILQDA